jgi:hypothetical protein
MWTDVIPGVLTLAAPVGVIYCHICLSRKQESQTVQFETYELHVRGEVKEVKNEPIVRLDPSRIFMDEDEMSDDTMKFLNENMELAGSPVRYLRRGHVPPAGPGASSPASNPTPEVIASPAENEGFYWMDGTVRTQPEPEQYPLTFNIGEYS